MLPGRSNPAMDGAGGGRAPGVSRGESETPHGLDDTRVGFQEGRPDAVREVTAWMKSAIAFRVWGFESPGDIVQASLLALLGNLKAGSYAGGDFRAYVRHIAKNICVSASRRARTRGIQVPIDAETPGHEVQAPDTDVESRALLFRILDRLDGSSREILSLAYLEGLSRSEIGERLGISEGTARVRLFRGLTKARALVEKHHHPPKRREGSAS